MKTIDLATQGEAVQKFFHRLQIGREGSLVEMNGHAVAHVLPVLNNKEPQAEAGTWTENKNTRRCKLIDREIAGTLTSAEALELTTLQQQMLAYRQKVAPLPIEDARRLHQELLRKATNGHTRRQA